MSSKEKMCECGENPVADGGDFCRDCDAAADSSSSNDMITLPDIGNLPDLLDKQRVYKFRAYCLRLATDDDGYYEESLEEATAAAANEMAEGAEFVTIDAEDGEMRWVPGDRDRGERIGGKWCQEITNGKTILTARREYPDDSAAWMAGETP